MLANELALSFEPGPQKDLLSAWETLAAKLRAYVLPGTYHCSKTYANVAEIIAPGGERAQYHKQNSATRNHEFVHTPDTRGIKCVVTDYGNLLPLTCLDIYDAGLILKLLAITNRFSPNYAGVDDGYEPQVVLVPSFNQDPNLLSIAKRVSAFTGTVVAVANAFTTGQDTSLECECYFGGAQLAPIAEHQGIQDPDGVALQYRWRAYEFDMDALIEQQAKGAPDQRPFSTQFRAIVAGGPVLKSAPAP